MELIDKKTNYAARLDNTNDEVDIKPAHSDHTNLVVPNPYITEDL